MPEPGEPPSREPETPQAGYEPPAVAWEQSFEDGVLTSACAKIAADALCTASPAS